MQISSPADFVKTMSKSVRERTELIARQTKELAALGQQAARRAIEEIASGR
jgi:3-oxoacyl-[acyl-carrier-protein] synthase III